MITNTLIWRPLVQDTKRYTYNNSPTQKLFGSDGSVGLNKYVTPSLQI